MAFVKIMGRLVNTDDISTVDPVSEFYPDNCLIKMRSSDREIRCPKSVDDLQKLLQEAGA